MLIAALDMEVHILDIWTVFMPVKWSHAVEMIISKHLNVSRFASQHDLGIKTTLLARDMVEE